MRSSGAPTPSAVGVHAVCPVDALGCLLPRRALNRADLAGKPDAADATGRPGDRPGAAPLLAAETGRRGRDPNEIKLLYVQGRDLAGYGE